MIDQEREKTVLKGERLRIIMQIREEEREKLIKIAEGLERDLRYTENNTYTIEEKPFVEEKNRNYNQALQDLITEVRKNK